MVRISKERLKTVSSNPMLLLIVGAIISSIIIPSYTRQWQDHQKELELKTNLADEINKAISPMIVSANYRHDNTDPFQTNKNWLISKAMISSKIKAYFSDIQITQDWNNLSSVVSQLYVIGGGLPAKNTSLYNGYFCQLLSNLLEIYRLYPHSGPMNINGSEVSLHHCNSFYFPGLQNIQYIQKYFPAKNNDIDWNALLHVDNATAGGAKRYNTSFNILEKHIEDHTNKFLDTMFKSAITVFE
jgi:hypothetical protein